MTIQIIDMNTKAEHIPVFVGKTASGAPYTLQESNLANDFIRHYFVEPMRTRKPLDGNDWYEWSRDQDEWGED